MRFHYLTDVVISFCLSLFLFFHQALFLNKCSSQNSDQWPHFHQSNACVYPRAQSCGDAAWGLVLNLISLTSFNIGSPPARGIMKIRNNSFPYCKSPAPAVMRKGVQKLQGGLQRLIGPPLPSVRVTSSFPVNSVGLKTNKCVNI